MMSCLLSINTAKITVAISPRYWIIPPKSDEPVKIPEVSKDVPQI